MLGKPKHLGRWLAIAAAIGLCCSGEAWAAKPVKPPPPPPPEEPVTYTMVVLSNLRGWAPALNQLDSAVEIAGVLYDDSGDEEIDRAHYWMVQPSGNVLVSMDLQTLPPIESGALVDSYVDDVNNSGNLVGWQEESGNRLMRRPLFWPSAASVPIELPLPETPAGAVGALASSINDAGIAIGIANNADGSSDLVAWKLAMVDGGWVVQDQLALLTALPDHGIYPFPKITNSGYVGATLVFQTAEGWVYRAYRLRLAWDASQVWEVQGSSAPLFDSDYSTVNGINEAGTVCGRCANPAGGWGMAYAMNVGGVLLDLPVLPAQKVGSISYGETFNEQANAINNRTPVTIVGRGSRSGSRGTFQTSEKVPLRWEAGTSVTDLRSITEGSLPLYKSFTGDINDAGWITAQAEDSGGRPTLPLVLIPSR